MTKHQVVACFVIYSEEDIAFQGTFQVTENTSLYSSKLTDNSAFNFHLDYEGTQCFIILTYFEGASVKAQLNIETPINRTKVKWKQAELGGLYSVHYRCSMEFPEYS